MTCAQGLLRLLWGGPEIGVLRDWSYSKAITTPGVLVGLEVIDAILNIIKPVAKKLQGIQGTILTALNAIASCKDVIQVFRNNEEIFVGLFRHAEGLYGESIPMSQIVNQPANRANPPAVSPLQFYRRSVFFLSLTQCLSNSAKDFALILLIA